MIELLKLAVLISLVFLVVVMLCFIIKLWKSNSNFKDISSDIWSGFAIYVLKCLIVISIFCSFIYMVVWPIPISFYDLYTRLIEKGICFLYLIGLLSVSGLFSLFEFAACLGIIESIVGVPNIEPEPSYYKACITKENCSTVVGKENSCAHEKRKRYSSISRVDSMTPLQFEKFCADLLRYNNFNRIKLTSKTGDQGVDIVAQKGENRYAIQCKHYSSNVGNKAIQEVYTGKTVYGCNVGVVITNSHFTPKAKEIARITHTVLWGREQLQELMNRAAKAKYP